MLFLNKEEKILVLLFRIEQERAKTLLGAYKSYDIGEKKIVRLKEKIIKLGGNTDTKISIE